ncbi:Afadin and alpha-actinin-binding-domain-containing protein [Xylaria nigripes]|nr:Afadin and alpha-actinin-binding-domain-containing protein [Xylaria nigripes]
MIDPDNLRTASLYINNQLLSRGLLRDGQNIDFADPESSDGGLQVAMGRIISVVNDLILRRDRDAEHRESLSSTLITLRADVQRQTTELSRQTDKLNDAQRRLDIAEATERALRSQLKTAEQGIHRLKEEMAKLKSLVTQTRSACANEVRKRDRQIESLKKAVTEAGRVRGGGKSRDVMTINVTNEIGGPGQAEMGMPVGATANEGYSLRMETNEFLTELAKGLSEENEGLLALVRHTVDGLREMSGLERSTDMEHGSSHGSHGRDEFAAYPSKKSAEELATELEGIVEHLRSILTNPSFVPIEEVEVRDEAINRLRAGLETMEARWKDAVHMIDGWRRRMVSGGKSVNMEDLQMGLKLSPVRVRDVQETAHAVPLRLARVREERVQEEDEEAEVQEVQEVNDIRRRNHEYSKPEPQQFRTKSPAESLRLVPAPGYEAEEYGDESDSESSIFQDDLDMDDLDVEEPNVQILQISTAESIDSSPLPEPPQISPLKDSYSSGNRGSGRKTAAYRKKQEDFSIVENTWDLVDVEKEAPTPRRVNKAVSPKQKSIRASTPSRAEEEDALPNYTTSYDSPLFGKSGEKPSQAQLNRKLFSRPSSRPSTSEQQRPKSTSGQTNEESAPSPRAKRLSARKSAEVSPEAMTHALRRTLSEPKSKSNSRSGNASTNTANMTNQQKQAAEGGLRNSSTTASPEKQSRLAGSAHSTAHSTASSRLPRPQGQQSTLNMATIAAKLAASEREADAARVRAKLKAVRRSRRISGIAESEGSGSPRSQSQSRSQVQTRAQTRAQTRSVEAETRRHHVVEDEDDDSAREDMVREQRLDEDVDPVKKVINNTRSRRRLSRRRRSVCADGEGDANEMDELAYAGEEEVARGFVWGGNGGGGGGDEEEATNVDGGLELEKRRRVRRVSKAVSRRRSTLSPWELQGLIQGSVEGSVR